MTIRAVISDFGGVLTTPLAGGFANVQERWGTTPEQFGIALAALTAARAENPLFALETGALGEQAFLDALGATLGEQSGAPVSLDGFGEAFFAGLSLNRPFLTFLESLRDDGVRLAICTNNVREWSARWRAMVPAPSIFEVVVDSSEIGVRKPDPAIYEAVLAEIDVPAADAVFIDDLEVNCTAARELGMHAVWFQSTEQAIADTRAVLAPRPAD